MTMDYKQFQEWLSGIEQLSPAQRQQAEAVFPGASDRSASLAAVEASVGEDASARIVAHQGLYRVARQGVCGGTSARGARRHSMRLPAPPWQVFIARIDGLPLELVLQMG